MLLAFLLCLPGKTVVFSMLEYLLNFIDKMPLNFYSVCKQLTISSYLEFPYLADLLQHYLSLMIIFTFLDFFFSLFFQSIFCLLSVYIFGQFLLLNLLTKNLYNSLHMRINYYFLILHIQIHIFLIYHFNLLFEYERNCVITVILFLFFIRLFIRFLLTHNKLSICFLIYSIFFQIKI